MSGAILAASAPTDLPPRWSPLWGWTESRRNDARRREYWLCRGGLWRGAAGRDGRQPYGLNQSIPARLKRTTLKVGIFGPLERCALVRGDFGLSRQPVVTVRGFEAMERQQIVDQKFQCPHAGKEFFSFAFVHSARLLNAGPACGESHDKGSAAQ